MKKHEITYARAGGPPKNWREIEVVHVPSGQLLEGVIEVNTAQGYLRRFSDDAEPSAGLAHLPVEEFFFKPDEIRLRLKPDLPAEEVLP